MGMVFGDQIWPKIMFKGFAGASGKDFYLSAGSTFPAKIFGIFRTH